MEGARLPKIGELVEFSSLFKEERTIGIVIWVPSDDEINEKLKNDVHHDTFIFKVLTQHGYDDYWTEWEWNYIDICDVKKSKN